MIPARSRKRARLRGRGWHIQREHRTRTADARIRAEHPSVATRRHTTNTGRPYDTAPSSGLHWLSTTPPCHPKPLSLNTAAHDSPRPAHLAASTPIRRRKPVIVVEVAVHRRQRQFGGPAEILDVAAELASHNVTIIRQDNHRLTATLTATIVLAQPHTSPYGPPLGRYAAGCLYRHSLVYDAPISAHGPSWPRTTSTKSMPTALPATVAGGPSDTPGWPYKTNARGSPRQQPNASTQAHRARSLSTRTTTTLRFSPTARWLPTTSTSPSSYCPTCWVRHSHGRESLPNRD